MAEEDVGIGIGTFFNPDGVRKAVRAFDDLEDKLEDTKRRSDLLADLATGAVFGAAFTDGIALIQEWVASAQEYIAVGVELLQTNRANDETVQEYTASQEALNEATARLQEEVVSRLLPVLTELNQVLLGLNVVTFELITAVDGAIFAFQGYSTQLQEFLGLSDEAVEAIGTFIEWSNKLNPLTGVYFLLADAAKAAWEDLQTLGIVAQDTSAAMFEAADAAASFDRTLMQSSTAVNSQIARTNELNAMLRDSIAAQEAYEQSVKDAAAAASDFYAQQYAAPFIETAKETHKATLEQEKLNKAYGRGVNVVSEQERALERLNRAQADYFEKALDGELATDNLNRVLFDSAKAAGAGIESLQLLAAATGEYTEEQIKAAVRQAALIAQVRALGEAIAAGTITEDQAIAQVQNLQNNVSNVSQDITINAGAEPAANIVQGLQAQGG